MQAFWFGMALGAMLGFMVAGLLGIEKYKRMQFLENVADAAECYRLNRFHGDSDVTWNHLENKLRELRLNSEDKRLREETFYDKPKH